MSIFSFGMNCAFKDFDFKLSDNFLKYKNKLKIMNPVKICAITHR